MSPKKQRLDSKNNNKAIGSITEYLFLIVGCFITAASFNIFLAPNRIASGGAVGLSIIIKELTGFEPAITQWGINIVLFAIGTFLMGGTFGIKTAVGSFLLPFFILITRGFLPITNNPLLASIYAGIFIGAGLGLVFRSRGSTGGFSIGARILNKYSGVSIGRIMMLLDAAVIVLSGFVFDAETALYALIVVFITGKAIDLVQMGFSYSKVAFVISDRQDRIIKAILEHLDRGLTKLPAVGGFTGDERTVLMIVMSQSEIMRFKALVKSEDPQAFIIISDTNEVLGQGFKLYSH